MNGYSSTLRAVLKNDIVVDSEADNKKRQIKKQWVQSLDKSSIPTLIKKIL